MQYKTRDYELKIMREQSGSTYGCVLLINPKMDEVWPIDEIDPSCLFLLGLLRAIWTHKLVVPRRLGLID